MNKRPFDYEKTAEGRIVRVAGRSDVLVAREWDARVLASIPVELARIQTDEVLAPRVGRVRAIVRVASEYGVNTSAIRDFATWLEGFDDDDEMANNEQEMIG